MKLTITPVDGEPYVVTTTIRDQVNYSDAAGKRKWRGVSDDPLLFQNYLAFSAARRTGRHTGTWDQFLDTVAEVELDEEDDEDPTAPAIGPI